MITEGTPGVTGDTSYEHFMTFLVFSSVVMCICRVPTGILTAAYFTKRTSEQLFWIVHRNVSMM